jgi:thymidylate kinase
MTPTCRFDRTSLSTLEQSRSCRNFLSTLFAALDTHKVRYCVLHSWEELPERLSSDLDMAVHPDDVQKVPLVLQILLHSGFTPVQLFNYFVNAYYFVFFWLEGATISSVAIDIILEHRRGGLIESGESLLSGRRRHGIFWIPSPESEFTYLLAKKSWKGNAPPRQLFRLSALVELLGRPTAERLAGQLFLGELKASVVDACATGRVDRLLPELKAKTWLTSVLRNPWRSAAYLVSDSLRRVRRWVQPTGLFVVAMGTDGVGKTTILRHVVQALGPGFRRHRVFHLRPGAVCRRKNATATDQPHSQKRHGAVRSTAKLVAYLFDYWFGYWLLVRPLLARSGLVVFDRYFDDLLIDPQRYRYGGPRWAVKAVQLLVPQPDLVLVMDAPAEVVLSRKQEISSEEVERQRRQYCEYQRKASNRHLINASASIEVVTVEAVCTILDSLAERLERRHRDWLIDT